MTPAEALRALHKAGRIRSPWLPGMLCGQERILHDDKDRTEVAERENDEDGGYWYTGVYDRDARPDGSPDLTDPATVGCLLALLREAVHEWTPHPQRGGGAVTARDARSWHVWVQTGPFARERYDGATEGEAIAAGLIALASP